MTTVLQKTFKFNSVFLTFTSKFKYGSNNKDNPNSNNKESPISDSGIKNSSNSSSNTNFDSNIKNSSTLKGFIPDMIIFING